ncbi:MAG TPA: MBOAT family O-acyltransferase [Planctomycetota bacterium]|nr:MBOAT family O-acyltransferase [Planctomycetota bacterium]
MVFNSLLFALFLSVVFVLDRLTTSWKLRKVYLLIASFLFYGAWCPPYIILLLVPTVADWYAAKFIAATPRPGPRRAILIASLCLNLGLLASFKYASFLWDTAAALAGAMGFEMATGRIDILLPVGISFYTFATMSYTIDVYRREIVPAKSFLDYSLFVAFFPHLVAGPILRAGSFLPQCEVERRADRNQIGWGLTLLTLGLFGKVVLADGILAPVVDRIFAARVGVGCAEAWVASLGFAGQVFFDFAGYSSCALGSALLLGWTLPENFRFPFAALGFADFWRRWHISLSTWLRDYLYVALRGNRRGQVRQSLNMMATMLLGGLWHGASWKFVVWGGLQGVLLAVEVAAKKFLGIDRLRDSAAGRFFLWAGTFFAFSFTWPFFRAADLASACSMAGSMASPSMPDIVGISSLRVVAAMGIVACMFALHCFMRYRTTESMWSRMPWPARSVLLAAMIVALFLVPGDSRAFIYFQF